MSWDSPYLRVVQTGAPAIAYRIFSPQRAAKAAVLLTHGYFENMQRYREVIARWNELDLLVATYDLRGHGLSEGRRGYIDRFDDYVDDALAVLEHLKRHPAWAEMQPPALFGHSLGGLIAIHVALRAADGLAGVALSSPYLGLAQELPALKRAAGRVLSRVFPRISLDSGLRGADCTRNAQISSAYDHDPMNFKKANVRWFSEATRAQTQALAEAPRLTLPLYCLQAGDDKVAQAAATERFMERVSSVERQYLRLPGMYHEVLNEPERAIWIDKFASAMLAWRSPALPPTR
jgi:alpha-beta hydrolase superfamily lysophospholipase